ncbi:MAG: hypothetical protein HY287_05265 [Planctomycetes bacterium]|nr:hypothetical protein [Planctomycetota bacterium]MBI3833721.1 hypothetical protein [Planctomycetota bacterium]
MFKYSNFERGTGWAVAYMISCEISLSLSGCIGVPIATSVIDGNVDTTIGSPLGKTSGEPNNTFADFVVVVFANGEAHLQGMVASDSDLDVYLLGAMAPGDHLVINASAFGSTLDTSIAVFDNKGRLTYENDDVSDFSLDSHIDFVVRHAGNPYYLVVTHSAFAASTNLLGAYHADIVLNHIASVPQPESQTILLKFNGGQVNSPVLGTFVLSPFDAADIAPVYAGKTDIIKNAIVDTIRQNYERFNVITVTSDDPPPSGAFSTVFFGGFSREAYGLSEDVDLYDADCCDDSIIYTQTFTPDQFTGTPTPSELGLAIGNIASHEAAHLLGLNHTNDDSDLMDDSSPADAFISNQEFKEAPLSKDIMPIGKQDGVLLLSEIVGFVPGFSGPRANWFTAKAGSKRAIPPDGKILRKKMQVTKRKAHIGRLLEK